MNYEDHGNYGEFCIKCNEIYIGQTVNSFSKNGVRIETFEKIMYLKQFVKIDKYSLIIQYKNIQKQEVPDNLSLDYSKQLWIKKSKLNSSNVFEQQFLWFWVLNLSNLGIIYLFYCGVFSQKVTIWF